MNYFILSSSSSSLLLSGKAIVEQVRTMVVAIMFTIAPQPSYDVK